MKLDLGQEIVGIRDINLRTGRTMKHKHHEIEKHVCKKCGFEYQYAAKGCPICTSDMYNYPQTEPRDEAIDEGLDDSEQD
jgi:predicted Zn-ribbon and HTH transcriptional regulator